MKRINEKSINIDREGDELILTLNIFNSEHYDLINRRVKKTDSIIELEIFNNSLKNIKINNPELVIYDMSSQNSKAIRYNSSRLETTFPFLLSRATSYKIAYNSNKMIELLKHFRGEVIKFQIGSDRSKYFETLSFGGDDLTEYLERRDQVSSWKHKEVYEFDNKI